MDMAKDFENKTKRIKHKSWLEQLKLSSTIICVTVILALLVVVVIVV